MGDQSGKYLIVVSILLQNEVALESVQVTSDPIIESINPTKRGCLFNSEQPENFTLKAHKKYTQVKSSICVSKGKLLKTSSLIITNQINHFTRLPASSSAAFKGHYRR